VSLSTAPKPTIKPEATHKSAPNADHYSTVTLLARLRGLSTLRPRMRATW
jgi:hypothetical protein